MNLSMFVQDVARLLKNKARAWKLGISGPHAATWGALATVRLRCPKGHPSGTLQRSLATS